MSEGSRFLDFARNDKTQNFLLRYFHRAEVYFPIDVSRERFDCAAVLIGLSEAAPDAAASASVASAKEDCFAQSSITSEMRWLSC
jgi:hypothetical protein